MAEENDEPNDVKANNKEETPKPFKTISAILAGVTGVLANVPGLVLIAKNIYMVPGESRDLYRGLQGAFCGFLLLIVLLYTPSIATLARKTLFRWTSIAFFAFALFFGSYLWLYEECVLPYESFQKYYHEHKDPLLFPIIATGDLKTQLGNYKGDKLKMIEDLREDTERALTSSHDTVFMTKVLFMAFFSLAMGALTLCFAMLVSYFVSHNMSFAANPEAT